MRVRVFVLLSLILVTLLGFTGAPAMLRSFVSGMSASLTESDSAADPQTEVNSIEKAEQKAADSGSRYAKYRIDETTAIPLELNTEPAPQKRQKQEPRNRFSSLLLQFATRFRGGAGRILSNLLQFNVISISGNYRVSEKQILRAAQLSTRTWVWQRSISQIQEAVEQIPWIEKAELSLRLLPTKISIKVKEAEPWLVAEFQGNSWLVSHEGKLIENLSSLSEPELIMEASELMRLDGLDSETRMQSVLSSTNRRFTYAIKLIRFLEMGTPIPFAVERMTLLAQGSLRIQPVDFSRYPTVKLSARSLAEAQRVTAQLAAVLKDIQNREERVKEIDLRFQNQAVLR